ncbi:MAG: IclR family transcriptional regulator [Gemmobacter sp.]|nr:IclR family transcriptional regulator [Gemmobacter sp.]
MPTESDTAGQCIEDREADEGDRQFVTALARGLDILGCFRHGDRYLSNQEIARRTQLARPTVSRLTHTLTRTGHLVRDGNNNEYRLGGRVLQMGLHLLSNSDVRERFLAEVEGMNCGPNSYVTVALAERAGTRAVYLASSQPRDAIALSIGVGAQLPLFYSGIGRAILVGMGETERNRVLAEACNEFPDHRTRMERSIADALNDYATFGYCTSFGAWKPEITSIAAPCRSLDGRTVYGVNIGGPTFLVSGEQLHTHYGQRLLEFISRIGL